MKSYILLAFILLLVALIFRRHQKKHSWKKPVDPFPDEWQKILNLHVPLYTSLNVEEKVRFEYKIQEFLANCRIVGIKTDINDTDRLLIASSAIIPILSFPDWQYNLSEVLVYPGAFDEKFDLSENPNILGMVGSGYMEGKMILSKPAVYEGFKNETDKRNTAIHEFIHLIDKADGKIDGIPKVLMEKQYILPWLDLIHTKIDEIYQDKSDINPYGATNKAEFLAVLGEYFFERPKLLSQKHPELYKLLEEMFNQKMTKRIQKINKSYKTTGRNDPCPCGSGLKFKKCCGKDHF
jgi:Mlc titration factor MtfA (ptsG expression regulator)